jgi:hypothetical protein
MNGRAAARVVSRRQLQATFIASLLLIRSTPTLPTERVDPHLLPTSVRYTRNSKCNAVNIHMPPSTHSAIDGNMISPKPADMPLSQGDTAICFAYATTDMISQRVGTEISALDVATKYYFADPSRLAQSTNPDLQRYLRGMGDYRAAIAESRAATDVSSEHNPGRHPYIDMLEGGEEDIAALLYNVGGLCKDQDLPSYDGYTHFAAYLALLRTWMRVFPPAQYSRISLAGAAPALLSPKTDAFNAAWISRVERQCRRRPLPVPLLPVNYRVATNQASFMQLLEEGRPPSDAQVDRMFSMIDYSLDHNRAPAVGYSWYVLEKRDPNDMDLVADHSSVIIGRRRVGETCQYRVQDNTGEYCAPMREGIRDRCELGRIWLTEDELKRTLYSVTYLR